MNEREKKTSDYSKLNNTRKWAREKNKIFDWVVLYCSFFFSLSLFFLCAVVILKNWRVQFDFVKKRAKQLFLYIAGV
jgi:hypothetical protein